MREVRVPVSTAVRAAVRVRKPLPHSAAGSHAEKSETEKGEGERKVYLVVFS